MKKLVSVGHFLLPLCAWGCLLAAPPEAEGLEKKSLEPLIRAAELPPYRWFASTDPKAENNDFIWLKPGQSHRVPLAPGKLERLWSTSSEPDGLTLKLVLSPRQTVALLAGGKAKHGTFLDKAYTLFPVKDLSAGGIFSGNLPTGVTLVGTNNGKAAAKWYYQATVRPAGAKLVELPPAQTVTRRLFKVNLEAGEEKSVDVLDKPGLIYELSVGGANDKTGAQELRALRLRAAWEGKTAIDAPLLALAGQLASHGLLKNAVANFDGTRLVLHWPMPLERGQIWLKNTGLTTANLDVGIRFRSSATPPSPYRFCALEQTATPAKGKPVEILRVDGPGALLGMALALEPKPDSASRTFAYLEGNELIRADGKLLEGTGTEDYFSSAWYFPDKTYTHAYDGLVKKVAMPPSVSTYRLMVPDPVSFKKSLQFDFEHGRGNNRDDIVWNWVCFWYQKAPLNLAATGPTAVTPSGPGPQKPQNLPLWWVAVGGPLVGVLLYLAKRRQRLRKAER